jgi:hypothetical protein
VAALGACALAPAAATAGFTVRYHFQRASLGRFTFRVRLRPTMHIRIRAV